MKAKYLGVLLVILTFIGCDDNTAGLGLGMLPDSDKLTVKTKTYKVQTKSFLADSVFAKTNIGYVGKFSDDLFGFYDAGFLTQLNCTENFTFPKLYSEDNKEGIMAGDSLVTQLVVYYPYSNGYFGDSLKASRMSIYELNKDLTTQNNVSYYTTINPEDYYDKNDKDALIARKAYTAVDLSVKDSLRRAIGNFVSFTLPEEFGKKRFRDLNWEHPEYFKNADTFIENVFKGLYIKNDFGDGTILYIDAVMLSFRYNCHYKDSVTNEKLLNPDGTDSIYTEIKSFTATKEVIQANHFTNSDLLKKRVEEKEHTYIKSPAGIFTQALLPIQEIYDERRGDTLNSVKLTFTGYQPDKTTDAQFKMNAPQYVLLIREKEMKTFFEDNLLTDNITSHVASLPDQNKNPNTYTYTFNNLTFLINACIEEKEEVRKNEGKDWTAAEWEKWEKESKWNSILLVPVIINTDSNTSTTLSIQNDMKPGYLKLKGGEKGGEMGNEDNEYLLDLEVHYTEFQD